MAQKNTNSETFLASTSRLFRCICELDAVVTVVRGDYSLHQKQRHSVGPSGGIYQISIDDRLYQNVDRYRPIPQDDCRVDVITISDLPFALHRLKLVFNGHTPAAWPANGYMDINEFR
ncbi:hypothetical protein FRC03_004287, partial [Tulasnella sp. 419]